MSDNFVKSLKKESNWKKTENYADALKSSLDPVLDLFGTIGSLRTREQTEIEKMFALAYRENPLLALKLAFYCRDIRNGGLGERRTPRIVWRWIAENHPDVMEKNLQYIPHFGRWDDLYVFVGTLLESNALQILHDQFKTDLSNLSKPENLSLVGKWLKSENTSSKTSRVLGRKTREFFGLTPKQYRKLLSALRKTLNVVERKMSANNWKSIRYRTVPSRAMMIYRRAFERHDPEGWSEYMSKVEKGEEKINASTLFPYDIFRTAGYRIGWRGESSFSNMDSTLQAQWDSLPNYLEGIYEENQNCLVMADTSGSMHGLPILVSVSLAVYFAERNTGPFRNVFLTFSRSPEFCEVKGKTLAEKVAGIESIVANTNIESAFKLVLDTAVKNSIPAEEMPKAILIISDMEFDQATQTYGRMSYYDRFEKMFNEAGYRIPNIIFWNVAARNNTFHVTSDYKGVQLASGSSPSVFRSILLNMDMTPVDAMLNTLLSPAYEMIQL